VLEQQDPAAERSADAFRLTFEEPRPARVVVREHHRAVQPRRLAHVCRTEPLSRIRFRITGLADLCHTHVPSGRAAVTQPRLAHNCGSAA
jgi:hypothetical protein